MIQITLAKLLLQKITSYNLQTNNNLKITIHTLKQIQQ